MRHPFLSRKAIEERIKNFAEENLLPNNIESYQKNQEYEKLCFLCGQPHNRTFNSYADSPYLVSISENIGTKEYRVSGVYQCENCYEQVGIKMLDKRQRELNELWENNDVNNDDMENHNLDAISRLIRKYLISGLFALEVLESHSYGRENYKNCVFCGNLARPKNMDESTRGKNLTIMPAVLGNSQTIFGPVQICKRCFDLKNTIDLALDTEDIEKYQKVISIRCKLTDEYYFVDENEWGYIREIIKYDDDTRSTSVESYNANPQFISPKAAKIRWNNPRAETVFCQHVTDEERIRTCGQSIVIDYLSADHIVLDSSINSYTYSPRIPRYCSQHRKLYSQEATYNRQGTLPLKDFKDANALNDIELEKFTIDLDPLIEIKVNQCICTNNNKRYVTTWAIKNSVIQDLSRAQIDELHDVIPLDILPNGVMVDLGSNLSLCNPNSPANCSCYDTEFKLGLDIGKKYIMHIKSKTYNEFIKKIFKTPIEET